MKTLLTPSLSLAQLAPVKQGLRSSQMIRILLTSDRRTVSRNAGNLMAAGSLGLRTVLVTAFAY
jgi:hypothetical protein